MMRWRVCPIREFHRWTTEWNTLNSAAGSLPFLRAEFMLPALKEFGTGSELLAICNAGDAVSAMGVLRQRRPGMWETFQPSQLPLGAFLTNGEAPVDRLLDSLLRALPGFAMTVALTQQDPSIVQRPSETRTLEALDYVDTARVTIAGTFDAYWAARGKNLRHNVKRQRAKLLEQGMPLRLERFDTPERVAEAIIDYGRLESSGWKAHTGTAIDPNNTQGRFYRSVFEEFCRMGSARVYRYLFGDQVVAMDLCLESAKALIVLKTTYDESVKVVSPATLMRHEIFKSIFDEGRFTRVEFYGKVMEWHLRWTGEVRTLYHVNRYRWAAIRRLRRAINDVMPARGDPLLASTEAPGTDAQERTIIAELPRK